MSDQMYVRYMAIYKNYKIDVCMGFIFLSFFLKYFILF